jgi:pimeloyl-ACP methyl ester carboxylesterase
MKKTVNGIELWYEKTGNGSSILLLHGNGESHGIFDALTAQLQGDYTVYALDSRDHGESEKTKDLSYDLMMEDTTAFIRALELEKPILYGFSDGGIIGLLLASRYPQMLSKLIVSGASLNPDSTRKKWLILFKVLYFFNRDKKFRLMLTEPDIHKEDLQKISVPTLVLAGERDMIREADTRFIAENIKGSTLKIIPKEGHMSYVIHSPKLYDIIKDFLKS